MIIDDDLALEGDEQFGVSFVLPPGVQSGSIFEARVTIMDNDSETVIILFNDNHS